MPRSSPTVHIARVALVAAAAASALAAGCGQPQDAALGASFTDRFDRAAIGADFRDTSARKYRIAGGALCVQGAQNHPLWLRRTLPRDVRVRFTARADSPEGDIKIELFGDGRSHATTASYTATSYVLVFGGWQNQLSVIARMDEHGSDRRSRARPAVEPDRTYRMEIERRGRRVAWRVDGEPFLDFDDPAPLAGKGHDHFAFNGWDAPVCFDDLEATAL